MHGAAALKPDLASPDAVLTASADVTKGLKRQLGTATEVNDEQRDAIRAKHAEIIGKNQTAKAAAEAAPEDPIILREDVAEIELELPNGMVVTMAPPATGSLVYKQAAILGGDVGGIMGAIVRSLLFVRKIDGDDPPPLNSRIDSMQFMDKLGEAGVDLVTSACQMTWPPMTLGDLKIVKKTLRP